jgi:hypothetical protein
VAEQDEVVVRVDEAGQQGGPAEVDLPPGGGQVVASPARVAHPGDLLAGHRDRGGGRRAWVHGDHVGVGEEQVDPLGHRATPVPGVAA